MAKKIENKTISKCLTRYLDEQWDLERNMEKQELLNFLKRVLLDGDEDTCNRLKDEVRKIKERVDEAIGKEKKNMERVLIRCGHVVRDFESEAKTRYNF